MAEINNDRMWSEFDSKFTPLISFLAIIDVDMSLVKNILINYRNEQVFDLQQDKTYIDILSKVYKRKQMNPLLCITRENADDNILSFVEECYEEFMAEREEEILQYAVSSEIYNLIKSFCDSKEVIPTILYYSQYQKDIIDKDPLLSKIKSVSYGELIRHRDMRNEYNQFYFKFLYESEQFVDLRNKTFYFSTSGVNLNENNDDIAMSNDDIIDIFTKGSKINLFDMYRTDIIGGYNNGKQE